MRTVCCLWALLTLAAGVYGAESAEYLLRQRRLPEAEAAFTLRVQRDARDAEAHHQLGRLALARRDFAAAMPHLEKAAELEPARAEYHFHYGAACVQHADQLGKTFKALGLARRGRAAMERAAELAPDRAEYQHGLIEYFARAPAIAGGSMEKARAYAQALRARDPREGTLALAGLHLRARQPGEAIALYTAHLSHQPDDYQVLYLLGRAAADAGEQVEAGRAALERCLRLPPPPRGVPHAVVNFHLGRLHQHAGDFDAARRAYAAALALEPDHTAARAALDALP